MLDSKYIPLFLGGFIVWMAFVICVGFFGSRGKREGEKFLTGGSDMSLFLIFCSLLALFIHCILFFNILISLPSK